MTWAVFLSIFAVCIVKVLMTCLPTGTVNWLIRKFEMHAKLREEDVIISINGNQLEREEKMQVIRAFNEATVLEKYTIYRGYNEHVYLNPENDGTPIVIDAKRGKQNIKIVMHKYNDHIDIVKQYKKKIIAYSVHVEPLQKHFMSAAADMA
ncbi:YfmQ family protein [Niallia nealsonii]|uniref:Uncharacterized protein n=1 Tax=Niallia nealsonii TaxID=115979 RepID=A0A2N0Z060_9BACI|nr:YfmQ family protein [Niallia nealsonii]PKG22896.1 hypothetical protein CWS01_14545 [Niallia nealsonii]